MIALSVSIGCLGYLVWLSLPLFGLVLAALLLGMNVQVVAQSRGVAGFWNTAIKG